MKKLTVGFLLFPGFQLLDLAGPSDAFGEVAVLSRGLCHYQVTTIGSTRGAIRSSSGVTIQPDRTVFDPAPRLDTLLIPGGAGVFDVLEDATLLDWLRTQSRSCKRVAAVCNGGFALGAAGLLDGRTVSTHWMDAARMASMFPHARVEPDRIYVKDGNLYTTAGVTAGIDLALVLVEEDFGRALAVDVAKYLVVYLRRAGGQSQFSSLLGVQVASDTKAAAIQQYVLDNLAAVKSVAAVAQRFHMSTRNISRVFKSATGTTLIAFINDARVDAARRLLESTSLSVKEIAARCGLDNAESLRRAFTRRLEISPVEYRARFPRQATGAAARHGDVTRLRAAAAAGRSPRSLRPPPAS
jgi:transcriptional regulator GlxA family with amidase domain